MKFFYDLKDLETRLDPIYFKLANKVQISAHADKHHSGKVDITEILQPFTHITLDEKYRIVAYSSYEIHGTFGKAVAIEKDKEIPDVYLQTANCMFQRIIPDVCYPVEEVIFCDGTPEGFFEVVALFEVIEKLFYDHNKKYYFNLKAINKKRELLFKPKKYSPQYYKDYDGTSKLLLLEEYSYDGSIFLSEYSFANKNFYFWQEDKQFSHIEFEKGRFSENKCCCYFSNNKICICDGKKPDFYR